MKLNDGKFNLDLSVTDLRLHNDDYSPKEELAEKIASRLENFAGIILGVGLTRPFAKNKEAKAVHWLQVTNIHLVENPIW